MKFTSKERKLTTNQKTMAIELGLADQKKAIELLYSQYRYPVQTCVQELVSNAFDAMQDAGKADRPIKVQLPTELNDFYFSVRDYGNSMDEDTIKNVYMRVNASTKSNSNKAIGGFGIGSKTPWAYTDTFILKTFLNGLETQYALVKGRSSVSIVYQGKTDQENGTEVIFKANKGDEGVFKDALERVTVCAKTKPITNVKINTDFDEVDRITPSIRLIKSDHVDEKVCLNVGGVLYDVPSEFLQSRGVSYRYRNEELIGKIRNLTDRPVKLLIDLPIGAVMPLQTREGLFTGGDEGKQNKIMIKHVVKYALKQIDRVLAERKANVVDELTAIDYFSNGMLTLQDQFDINGMKFTHKGIKLPITDSVSYVSRYSSRGWGRTLKTGKKHTSNFFYYSDMKNVYFSELSSGKARLVKRFHNIAATSDVFILEVNQFDSKYVYNFLKEYTKAHNIETVDVPATQPRAKSTVDKSKIVYYDWADSRIGSFRLNEDSFDKEIVVFEKGKPSTYGINILKSLGYKAIWVAKNNYQRVLGQEGFLKEDDALDFERIAKMYVNFKVYSIVNKLGRKNTDYIMKQASDTKQKLFNTYHVEHGFGGYNGENLVEKLHELYGTRLDKAIQKLVKQRVRVVAIVDRVPLAQHVERPEWLKGEAKKHLDAYIETNINA